MRHFLACLSRAHLSPIPPRALAALPLFLAVTLALAPSPGAWAGKDRGAASADVAALSGRTAAQTARQTEPSDAPGARGMPGHAPRKVLIVGDSFAVGLGLTLEQSLKPRGPVALASRGKVSSGLNSPRFYDWEKALADFLDAEKPDALVVMLGGNDAKNGGGTPEWSQDFKAKAARFLAIAGQHGVAVTWVGLPPMREKAFSQRAWTANEAMRAACQSAKSCRFVDSWDLFADKAGNFCAQKPIGGKTVSLRGKDGVHFSAAGCRLLTDRIATGLTPAP